MDAILRSEYFASRSASHAELVESSNRPASTVFRLRIQLGPEPQLFWVKTRPPGSLGTGKDEYHFLKRAQEAFQNEESLFVVDPVAYLPDFDALVTRDIRGIPLHRLIKKSYNRLTANFADRGQLESHFSRCGVWLAKLHAHALPSGEVFEPILLREYVDSRLAYLERNGVLDHTFRGRALEYLDGLLADIEADALKRVWTHGDFAPYNVIVGARSLSVLDPDIGGYFASLGNYCSRYEDIVHFQRFTESMSMTSGLIAPSFRRRLATVFLDAYMAAGGFTIDPRSAAFRAFRFKYELLAAAGMQWPSILGKAIGRRMRIRHLRRWFDRNCQG